MKKRIIPLVLAAALALPWLTAAAQEKTTFDQIHPGLLSGPFATATLGQLPEGVLVRYRGGELKSAELTETLNKAKPELKKALEKNAIFMAQEIVTKQILLLSATEAGQPTAGLEHGEVIGKYLRSLVADVQVTDAEVADYYKAHPEMFDGDSLKKVRKTLTSFLRKQKRQAAVDAHVRNLGATREIVLADAWAREQGAGASDNPLDKARASGKPTLVEFIDTDCPGCEDMKPVIASVERKYAGQANVISVMVSDYPVLGTRYGITAVPAQVFFDARGVETHRHDGQYSEKEIDKQLTPLLPVAKTGATRKAK